MNKTAFLTCSTKMSSEDQNELIWIRFFLLYKGYRINDDWINHVYSTKQNKTKFAPAPGFDSMSLTTNLINESDSIIFLLTSPSVYIVTLIEYALHAQKPVILIYKQKSHLKGISAASLEKIVAVPLKEYKQAIKEIV